MSRTAFAHWVRVSLLASGLAGTLIAGTSVAQQAFLLWDGKLPNRAELAKERATLEQAEPNRPATRGQSPETPRRRRPTHSDEEEDQP